MRNEVMYGLRDSRKLTQAEVAKSVGISQSAYAMIENGQRQPRMALQKRLADFFGVTVDQLFFAHDNHVTRAPSQASA